MKLRHCLPLSLAGLGLLALATFVGWKSFAVARELTDPPFYHPQPLSRVRGTYEELARGGPGDPGGTWTAEEVSGLQLWHFHRPGHHPGIVILLHGFGDDRWGTSPAVRWFPRTDAAIFTYLRRDDALRKGGPAPYVTFGAREAGDVVTLVHHLEQQGIPRRQILLMGRSLGASVGILALARLEAEGHGPLGGIIWEGAPASSRDFGQRLVRDAKDKFWHPFLAPLIGDLGSRLAARRAAYLRRDTDLIQVLHGRHLETPALCFLATQDRLAPPPLQRRVIAAFGHIRVIQAETWHLHCSEVLGPAYDEAIHQATAQWLPERTP
nr:hypothetical protein [uncultured Holophaga sp.]